VWNKEVPLKINFFVWRLLRNCIPIMDNLIRRQTLRPKVHLCVGSCGKHEDIDHLFFSCDFFRRIWYGISSWLGFTTVHPARVSDHLFQFDFRVCGSFGAKQMLASFSISRLQNLIDKIKLQYYCWMQIALILLW